MRKKNNQKGIIIILAAIIITTTGIILYVSLNNFLVNKTDSSSEITYELSATNSPTIGNETDENYSASPENVIESTQESQEKIDYANVIYIKNEVDNSSYKDRISFPNIEKCPIYIMESGDIDTDFLLDFAFNGNLSSVKVRTKETDVIEMDKESRYGGAFTGRADYEGNEAYLNYDRISGSYFISYSKILSGDKNEKVVDDNKESFLAYIQKYINNLGIYEEEYDINSVWISEKNKNDEDLQDIVIERRINGINVYPGHESFGNAYCLTMNTTGIGYFKAYVQRIKEELSADTEIITFTRALEIYNNNFSVEFTYAKFYYYYDIVLEDDCITFVVDGDLVTAYQSFDYKTTPVWVFFCGEMYDESLLSSNNKDKLIINALTGDIIKTE